MFSYFNGKVSHGFVSIYTARMILRIAGSFISLFLPIFLYNLFDGEMKYVIWYYLFGHLIYFFFVGYGARFLNKIGLRRSLRISVVLGAIYFLIYYFIYKVSENLEWSFAFDNSLVWLIFLVTIVLTFHRGMFWIPMHTDMAKFTDKKNRGKEVSLIEATTLAMSVAGPVAAGWILAEYNFDVLFIIGVLVYLISLIPLMTLPKTKERYSWSYKKTWKEFLSPQRRKTVLAFIGDGAEGAVGLIIWPIFMFELLKGNYFEVGALSSLIVLVTMFMQLAVGKFTDKYDKSKMIKWGSYLYAIGWIVKIFIVTAFQIFIASTYHSFAKIFARTPFDTMIYERAADQGHYVDEYTVIHEMAIQLGKSLMLVFALILIMFLEIQWVFALAAVASLAMNYLADENVVQLGRHSG